MKVYKVVRRLRNGRLTSAVTEGSARVTYIPGTPANGIGATPVLAFSSIEEARSLLKGDKQREIWEAEAEEAWPITSIEYWWRIGTKRSVLDWWAEKSHFKSMRAPQGSMACQSLTLTRRVA